MSLPPVELDSDECADRDGYTERGRTVKGNSKVKETSRTLLQNLSISQVLFKQLITTATVVQKVKVHLLRDIGDTRFPCFKTLEGVVKPVY